MTSPQKANKIDHELQKGVNYFGYQCYSPLALFQPTEDAQKARELVRMQLNDLFASLTGNPDAAFLHLATACNNEKYLARIRAGESSLAEAELEVEKELQGEFLRRDLVKTPLIERARKIAKQVSIELEKHVKKLPASGLKVLDLGCGDGRVSWELAQSSLPQLANATYYLRDTNAYLAEEISTAQKSRPHQWQVADLDGMSQASLKVLDGWQRGDWFQGLVDWQG